MDTIRHVPKTTLARQTRQIIQAVQRGQTVVVEHHGQPEAAIMDIMDYYLLRAVLRYHTHSPQIDADAGLSEEAVATLASLPEQVNLVIAHYLVGAISLSRAAELLNLPWLDLRTRCLRLDIPLRTAPATPDEIADDIENAAAFTTSSQ
ncbi:MAG: hypothetical protein M5U34_37030 [Chloroflexi bacterium]|jgi:predicted HTH domain antitoxin|nr:hypothetical protein [Chloroflexota bacterium]